MSRPDETTRGPSALAQPPRPVDRRRRFQLTEVLEVGEKAEAHPVYWNGTAWAVDTETTWEVRETLGKFWGAKGDRGFAMPAHDTDDGPFWDVCDNPGRLWYWARLDEDLTVNRTPATLHDGTEDYSPELGDVEVSGPLLTDESIAADTLIRVAYDLSTLSPNLPGWVAVGAPC